MDNHVIQIALKAKGLRGPLIVKSVLVGAFVSYLFYNTGKGMAIQAFNQAVDQTNAAVDALEGN